MLNQKVLEIVKRQTELAGLVASGKATEKDKGELETLTTKLAQLTGKEQVDVGKTKLTTMTLAEFKVYMEAEEAALKADLDPARLALLKRNVASVKAQAKKEMTDVVAVEISVEKSPEDRIDALEAKLDDVLEAVKAGFDGRTQTGVQEPTSGSGDSSGDDDKGDGDKGDVDKQDKPTAEALATEALDAIITRFQAIKDKIASGDDIDAEELSKMWPGWEMREMLEGAVAVLAKLEEAKTLVEEVMPELKKAAAGDDEEDEDDKGDDEDEDEKKKKKPKKDGDGDDDKDDTSKSDGRWGSGLDIAPKLSDKDAFTHLRKSRDKRSNL